MIANGKTRFSGLADNLLLLDLFALFNVNGTQMAVKGGKSKTVVDDDGVTIDAQIPNETYDPAVGRFHGISFGYGEIKAKVIGRVDRFIVVDVSSRVCEVGLHLGIGKLNEGTAPKHSIGGFLAHHADLVLVFFAQTMINLDKNILRIALARPDVV